MSKEKSSEIHLEKKVACFLKEICGNIYCKGQKLTAKAVNCPVFQWHVSDDGLHFQLGYRLCSGPVFTQKSNYLKKKCY